MKRLDPVSLEILWNRLIAIVDEAAAGFVRTSFSSLVREANDYAVVLTDAEGRSLAQSSLSIPSFISTLPNWGLASALGAILLGLVLVLYLLYDKIVGIDNMKLG